MLPSMQESLREMMLSVGFIEVEIGLDDIALHRIRVNADDNTDNVGLVMLWFTGIKQQSKHGSPCCDGIWSEQRQGDGRGTM